MLPPLLVIAFPFSRFKKLRSVTEMLIIRQMFKCGTYLADSEAVTQILRGFWHLFEQLNSISFAYIGIRHQIPLRI